MCGIAGIMGKTPIPAAEMVEICLKLSAEMAHRGPDDEGFLLIRDTGETEAFKGPDSDPAIQLPLIGTATGQFTGALVHRRLSIVGIGAAGHQPMAGESGTWWLTYNGEAFNYRLLNDQYSLSSKSGTDTETILHLLDRKRGFLAEQIDGFFSGIAYNSDTRQFLVFRDKTGVKPLFYTYHHNLLLLASETKALRAVTGTREVNPRAVFHLLTEGVLGTDEVNTVFSGIDEFPKGWIGTVDQVNKFERKKDKIGLRGDLPVDLEGALDQSIRRRLISDVPLGFAVSGGLDSAIVIGKARELLGPEAALKLFSITSSDPKSDESRYQKEVADFNHASWYHLPAESFGPELLEKVVKAADMPAVAWNNIAHFQLCKLAKDNGVTVLFNGQGADELFGGYPDYLQRNWFRLSGFLKKNADKLPMDYAEIRKGFFKFKLLQYLPAVVSESRFRKRFEGILTKEFNQFPSFLWSKSRMDADAKMQDDFFGKKLWQMLQWEDRNGMANSLESRNPFADDMGLASWLKVPYVKKISSGYTKGILRDAVKGLVPESVRLRVDKKGFTVPDAALTCKNLVHWEGALMSDLLDDYSPQNARKKLLNLAQQGDETALRWCFRFSSLSYFLQQVRS